MHVLNNNCNRIALVCQTFFFFFAPYLPVRTSVAAAMAGVDLVPTEAAQLDPAFQSYRETN